jgi:hypothetical protein
MRATPLLLGCLLGLSAIATAAANGSSIAGTLSNSAGSSYNCNHQSPEHSSNHDAAPSGGDALGVSHASADAETRAAEFRRTIDHQLALVGMHDVLHDRQADAVALHALVATHATLQHLFDLVIGDAGAVVFHAQPQARTLPAGDGCVFTTSSTR